MFRIFAFVGVALGTFQALAQDQITTIDGKTYNVVLEWFDENTFSIKTFSSRQPRQIPTDLIASFHSDNVEVLTKGFERAPYLRDVHVKKEKDKAFSGDIAILTNGDYFVGRTKEYCELITFTQFDSVEVSKDSMAVVSRFRIAMDTGLGVDTTKSIIDRAGRERHFRSVVEALNFMNTMGWEFMDLYPEDSTRMHYLLKRELSKDPPARLPR
ncbi:hypothetical protein SAMN05421823_10852 [Catalinimonas alkaloidigena]|uniref:Uncharacterized protein n=1 Tax=Catalinimonas alkaloidigena TaxID=1075417 RepID=A0A1G9MPW7_9BACT|nr:hypothetical protein [Catalinimonas alkaloidigena]SDL76290.1 hypothetical protein SAMN05421823_10852 [Catalinimonas alkaloidigena]